jgi:hypothetical protein
MGMANYRIGHHCRHALLLASSLAFEAAALCLLFWLEKLRYWPVQSRNQKAQAQPLAL